MHSLFKIFRKYIVTACFIAFLILFLNFSAYALFFQHYRKYSLNTRDISQISKELSVSSNQITLSEHGLYLLKNQYVWAMLLDEQGNMIWNWNLPKDLPTSYSLTEVASFCKWYLKDYPVHVWDNENGLLVAGNRKNSVWKFGIEMPVFLIADTPHFILLVLITNVVLILLLSIFFGYRFYRSLMPVAKGIEDLSKQTRIALPERGITAELSKKLNETSSVLDNQNACLKKRDTARTNWISGVSHDIRTPLSMVMGYAESLESDISLDSEQRQQASIIKNQSIKIKKLIEDLNLTSKLEYNMQPLRMTNYSPATLLREIVASYYNNALSELYHINLEIEVSVEVIHLQGDIGLLSRAFSNILDNCIHHNENGCNITVIARYINNLFYLSIADDGKGIPSAVITNINQDQGSTENSPHIMGLRIVKQIILAHHGTFMISPNYTSGCKIEMSF